MAQLSVLPVPGYLQVEHKWKTHIMSLSCAGSFWKVVCTEVSFHSNSFEHIAVFETQVQWEQLQSKLKNNLFEHIHHLTLAHLPPTALDSCTYRSYKYSMYCTRSGVPTKRTLHLNTCIPLGVADPWEETALSVPVISGLHFIRCSGSGLNQTVAPIQLPDGRISRQRGRRNMLQRCLVGGSWLNNLSQ